MKVETFIYGVNSIIVRLENIADVFDAKDGKLKYETVNIETLAEQLYMFANKISTFSNSVQINEMSLTANQLISTMNANKI